MKRILTPALLLLAACATPQERLAERALRLGASAYDANEFARADSLFASAPFDARALFNSGNSAFRLGQWGDAIGRFREAMHLDSAAEHRASVLFNLGAAHLADARDADSTVVRLNRDLGALRIEGNDIAQDVSTFVLRDSLRLDLVKLESSIDSSYAAAIRWNKAALRIAPADDDARLNLVLAQRGFDARKRARDARDQRDKDKDANKELGLRAQAIMQQADSLVEQYRFNKALELMQQGLREDPSLKQKEEYMKKLETVTNAAQAS
jgi:tetratricopeptide (TPR) repeat protein